MKRLVTALAFLAAASVLWGQSNAFLDRFLEKETADTATSLLLVAQAAGALPEDARSEDGYNWAMEQEFSRYVEKEAPDAPVSLGLCYLALLKSFGVRGGLWFECLGTPRQAAREANYLGYLESGTLYYTRSMTPAEVLSAISYVSADFEGGRK